MSRSLPLISALCLMVLACVPAWADGHGLAHAEDFLRDFDGVSKKLNDLAGAIPADKFDWRPAEGVRSVSESLVHVATANFFLAQALGGVAMPEGFNPREAESTVTSKKDAMALLETSQQHVRDAVPNADPKKEVELFGSTRTAYQLTQIIAGHSHEHLGQLIAYGRSNGVVPPWSQSAGN
ncbi:MAG: DinB family protein [Acidobacteriota bacterium]